MLALLGCTYVPFEKTREVSRTLPSDGTRASSLSKALSGGGEKDVAMAPLADGNDALGARLQMIEEAERSIDIKTFLIKPDIVGGLMWLQLFEAAERGVRVRLLFDDVFTKATDAQIAALDAHPNIEIRAFNPLSRNAPVAGNFLLDFNRVNRRMHNKAFVVDGSYAIIGGRNIADEYYQIGIANAFADFDLFVAGKPVAGISDAFDLYWNDRWSVPVSALAPRDVTPLSENLRRLRDSVDTQEARIFQRAVRSSYLADLRSGRVPLFKGRASVVVDDLRKLRTPPGKGPFIVAEALYRALNRAERDVLVMTPYFVPEDYGANFFERLVDRGVRVRIATNSLASTNHPYVHGAYAGYRDRLLAAGVEFLEARADAARLTGAADADLTMHTKLTIVDDRYLFVGSPNIDPRSIRQNAEMGMLIDSPELARSIRLRVDEIARDYAFEVSIGPDGRTVWRYGGSARQELYRNEPLATVWDIFVSTVASWLPIENQL